MGTAAMKPREKNGVVDARLNVYGTQALKVVDLSISPDNVGAVCPFHLNFASFDTDGDDVFSLHLSFLSVRRTRIPPSR